MKNIILFTVIISAFLFKMGICGSIEVKNAIIYAAPPNANNGGAFMEIKNLTDNPDILEYYSNKFKYVLVDEYQDTNKAQFTLVTLFASRYGNITVVGDNDQGIYSFRGADISNILNFEKDFPRNYYYKIRAKL